MTKSGSLKFESKQIDICVLYDTYDKTYKNVSFDELQVNYNAGYISFYCKDKFVVLNIQNCNSLEITLSDS